MSNTSKKESPRYQYISQDGELLFEKVCYGPEFVRFFNPVTGDGTNGHHESLYNAQNLKDLDGKRVYIVTEEKDVDALSVFGLLATTSIDNYNWPEKNNDLFIGAEVCILIERYDVISAYSDKIKSSLEALSFSTKIMSLSTPIAESTKEIIEKLFDGAIDHKFKTISFSSLLLLDMKPTWLIKNYIEASGICQIFGASGSGKSFFALDSAYCAASGIDFFGNKTKKCNVLFIAGEGFSGLKKRATALKNKYGADIGTLEFSMQAAELMSEESCINVADRIKANRDGFDLVYIDTLNRNMGLGDENSTKDMTQFISNIDKHIRALGCAVIIVHHTGLNNADRARGSGAMYNAIDSEFKVSKDEAGLITVTCTKQKEGESGWMKSLALKPVIVGFDEDSKENIYSCIVVETDLKEACLSVREQSVFDGLRQAIIEDGIDMKIEDEIEIVAVSEDVWRACAFKRLDTANKRRDFTRSKEALIKDERVFCVKGFYYIP